MTRQRRVILEELRAVTTHPTAEEVLAMVRKRLPRVSLGTVYRNLEVLCREGKALRMEPAAGGQRRFDGNTRRHYHVRCCRCGRLADVMLEEFTALHEPAAAASDFEILDHRLEFVGVCPGCKEEEEEEEAKCISRDEEDKER